MMTLLAHATLNEMPTGLLLFVAGTVFGLMLSLVIAKVRAR
jgi:hypothetical protein